MLIKESYINKANVINQLNEAVYLDESESMIQPVTIPVREMSRLGEGVTMVRFADVERLAEDSQVSYMDAVAAIAEASEVDASKLTVAVDEADLIVDPSLLDEMTNIVVAPLSESSLAYQYVSECIDAWAGMDDTAEVDAMLEAALVEDADLEAFVEGVADTVKSAAGKVKDFYTGDFKKASGHMKDAEASAKDAIAARDAGNADDQKVHTNATGANVVMAGQSAAKGAAKVALTAGGLALGYKILKAANNKPKSWIGQKIAALRSVYKKWMDKAQKADSSMAGRIKAAAGKIMAIIDQLMAKLQKAAG
jgi:activator of HSP90 ATPase